MTTDRFGEGLSKWWAALAAIAGIGVMLGVNTNQISTLVEGQKTGHSLVLSLIEKSTVNEVETRALLRVVTDMQIVIQGISQRQLDLERRISRVEGKQASPQ